MLTPRALARNWARLGAATAGPTTATFAAYDVVGTPGSP